MWKAVVLCCVRSCDRELLFGNIPPPPLRQGNTKIAWHSLINKNVEVRFCSTLNRRQCVFVRLNRAQIGRQKSLTTFCHKWESMKATGLYQVFFATIVFGLNGYFIANVCGNDGTYADLPLHYNINNNNHHYNITHTHLGRSTPIQQTFFFFCAVHISQVLIT